MEKPLMNEEERKKLNEFVASLTEEQRESVDALIDIKMDAKDIMEKADKALDLAKQYWIKHNKKRRHPS